ncbi:MULTISPECIES: hypothetical protein [unclassified Novosphingobium]|uniref:hypothetical protein n=1 Tax=unclassified Novosphingobium TaxID=2644732 RepID=UPI000EDD2A94|nr:MULTISPECIES: hypothetical protein [unclassified Novosphingobium]HCF24070.1 hypothetical protein [Novosphingobium sp.]HQV04416.1 hypothetical protein [Novosphingobium sp.]
MTHVLQTTFASAAGEAAWEETLRALFERRELAEAERILRSALVQTGGEMMRLCRQASLDRVAIIGWEELADAVAAHEGEAITGATVAMGNESDLAFEKGSTHRPYMMLGLYTDEAWDWSRAEPGEALQQCREESPAWAGRDEDLEAFLEIEGLDELNTALIHHKQRHFIRENDAAPAPLRYVEFVLGCWWRALRFHQAVAVQLDRHGLGGTIPVISGMIDMRPEVVSVHWPVVRQAPAAKPVNDADEAEDDALPVLSRFNLIQRGRLVAEDDVSPAGTALRRRLESAEAEAIDEVTETPGLMRRLLGRG